MKVSLESQESNVNQTNPKTSRSFIFHIQALRGNGDSELPYSQKYLPHHTCIMLLYEIHEALLKFLT